ncbi:MAG: DNA-protecting protein DprA [Nitrososphaerota archaeon]|jgi:DNA processing protein|nr:DNA-protecting protein DprA [Nitrososphaerota archaeon]
MIPKIYHSTLADLAGPKDTKTLSDKDKKLRLYCAGRLPIPLPTPRVAIVGSRKASPKGTTAAYLISQYLAEHHILVASGLAEGIDTTAHKATIETHGHTLAVLATPIDQVYPQKNYGLQQVIIQNHLAVSQFPSGTQIKPENFLQRNQTLAQLTHTSIIIEAKQQSGSLNHARHTLKLGHPLYIYHPLNQNQPWTKPLITAGAVFFTDPKDITEKLPNNSKTA